MSCFTAAFKGKTQYTVLKWRCTQDSNLQAVTGQTLSRRLPHHPDMQRIWCLYEDSNLNQYFRKVWFFQLDYRDVF